MINIIVVFIDFSEIIIVSIGILTFSLEEHTKVFDYSIETIRLGIVASFLGAHMIYLLFTSMMLIDFSKRHWENENIKEVWRDILVGSFYKYHGTIIYYCVTKRKFQDFSISENVELLIYKVLYYLTIIALLLGLVMLIFYKLWGLILLAIFPITAYLFYLFMLAHFLKTSDLDITKLDYYFTFLPSSNACGCFAYYRIITKPKQLANT